MAKFRFRLETLRRLREMRRDEQRGKLATAYQAAHILEQQYETLVGEITALQAAQRNAVVGGSAKINSLLEAQRYQAVLRAQQSTLEGQAKVLAQEVERRRQTLVEADREVRVLEKLCERQRKQYQESKLRAEMKQLDEFAVQRWERGQSWQQ